MRLLNILMSKGLIGHGLNTTCVRRQLSSTGTAMKQQKYWVLQYTYDPKTVLERRAPWRPQHLALAAEYTAKGKMVLGGAFADPVDGAMVVFHGDKADVEEFVRRDVYVSQGVATNPVIREWTVVTGASQNK